MDPCVTVLSYLFLSIKVLLVDTISLVNSGSINLAIDLGIEAPHYRFNVLLAILPGLSYWF